MSPTYCSKNFLLVVLAVLAFSLSSLAQTPACTNANCWKYSGATGPANWATLTPFALCSQANSPTQQSPIDIASAKQNASLPEIHFSYSPKDVPVENNGHTIEADYAGINGNSISYDGTTYNLLQFHFHAPSEHTIAGSGYPMELHLVHQAKDGAMLVVGVWLNPQGNEKNAALQKVLDHIPTPPAEHGEAHGLNAGALLPNQSDSNKNNYYTYTGSLTTPPCSPGITWLVLTTPLTIARGQWETFQKYYSDNARPVQPASQHLNLQQSKIRQ